MRILLTGAAGFVGGHLAEALLADGSHHLIGVSRKPQWPAELRHLAEQVPLEAVDLADGSALDTLLRTVQPEQIYHLAGYAHAGRSFREPDAAWTGNLTATRRLLEAVERWGGRARILYVSSGLVYGNAGGPAHIHTEDCLLLPTTPYAASKAAADVTAYQFAQAPGLDVIRVRPFNHIGPRQSPQYAVAHFAQQIAAIERGRQPPVLETGNLTPLRDLTDVRDVVRAYQLLMSQPHQGEVYNVCSGTVCSMQQVVDHLLSLARVRIEVRPRADLVRTQETAAVRGSAERLQRETGWMPRISLEQTLADTLEYWRQEP